MCISSNNMLSASSYRQRGKGRYYPQNLMLEFFLCSYLVVSIEYCLFDERETQAFLALFLFLYPAVINYSIISFLSRYSEVQSSIKTRTYNVRSSITNIGNDCSIVIIVRSFLFGLRLSEHQKRI